MKKTAARIVSMILVLAMLTVLLCTSAAAASKIVRYNVSTSAVTCNASNGSLPTSKSTLTGGKNYYFNLQVSSNLKIAKAVLYIKDVGDSSYTKVHTETASSYFRYVYYKYQVNDKSGNLKYYWKLTYTDGTTKTTDKTSVTVKKASSSSSSSSVINYNVSSSKVTCNASSGSLPTSKSTLTGGKNYYFNLQVSSNLKIAKAVLYIKDVGESSYDDVYTEKGSSYFRYVYFTHQVNDKSGTLYYYWKLTYTDGTTKTTDKTAITVKKNSSSSSSSSSSTTTTSSSWTYPVDNYYNIFDWGEKSTIRSGTSRIYHLGIDLQNSKVSGAGSTVYAASDGTVKIAKDTDGTNGKVVVIEHTIGDQKVYSFYAHLTELSVKKGDTVKMGDEIGTYGYNVSWHVHFAIFTVNNVAEDKDDSDYLGSGDYYGYGEEAITGTSYTCKCYSGGSTFTWYDPVYVIENGKLPT